MSQARGGYWTFADNKPSYSATSYALLILTSQSDWKEKSGTQVEKAVEFLRTGASTNWPVERDARVSGDFQYNFHHCTISWVLMAFLASGVPIFDPLAIKAMSYLYKNLYCHDTGGWTDEEGHRPGVFATSHAITAFELFHKSLSVAQFLNGVVDEKDKMAQMNTTSNNVFVVHGHDQLTKLDVARFLEQLGCNAIILDEQIDSGLTTIFQKLADYAEKTSYAIVLLTPDDFAEDQTGQKATRARQNVILELGLFLGKLGPDKVCLAKKGNVDIPTDVAGVLYLDLDDGGWKLKLAQKLKKAGIPIDLSKLV